MARLPAVGPGPHGDSNICVDSNERHTYHLLNSKNFDSNHFRNSKNFDSNHFLDPKNSHPNHFLATNLPNFPNLQLPISPLPNLQLSNLPFTPGARPSAFANLRTVGTP